MSEPFDRLSHFGDVESLHALLESTPYTKLLGIGVAEEPAPSRPLRETLFQRPARQDVGAEDGAGGESGAPVFVLRFSEDIIGNVRLPAIHGGVIGAVELSMVPGEDVRLLLASLVVVIVGGMGSVVGAAIGAAILGVAETFGLAYAPTYSVVFTFVILVLVLAFRPRGILGRPA